MHFLITAGGTREYIDPVRFISNASTGKFGFALVQAAIKSGHKVTLVAAPTSQKAPVGAKIVKAETAGQMYEVVRKYFARCDCLVMVAAVADYTPVKAAKSKIKKTNKPLTIKLKSTADILKWAGKHKRQNQKVIGFALEDKDVRQRAEKKLKEKNLDMIVANTPAAIGSDKAAVQIKMPGRKWLRLGHATKAAVAKRIISLASQETPARPHRR